MGIVELQAKLMGEIQTGNRSVTVNLQTISPEEAVNASMTRIVQLNRRLRVTLEESGVMKKFGVSPASIPDYLALVGDAADGPGGDPSS